MNPWLVVAGVVLIAMTPIVARLVIITLNGGKSWAEPATQPVFRDAGTRSVHED